MRKMMAARLIMSIQVVIMASWLPSTVTSFVGARSFRTQHETADVNSRGDIHRRSRSSYPFRYDVVVLGAKPDDDMDEEEVEGDPLTNDRREGMAGAFAGLDSLTADDFDDLVPLSSTGGKDSAGSSSSVTIDFNMEESAKLFMEMQAELSTVGEEGLYDDILGDLASDNPDVDAPKTFFKQEEDELTSLVLALDEAADRLAADAPAASDTMVLNDADGIGIQTSSDKAGGPLTTADVSNDILTQDIKPSLSMDDFISSALKEAVNEIEDSSEMISYTGSGRTEDIAKTAGQLLQNEELRKDIEKIFDVAGEKLRLEVEAIKKEQESVIQSGSKQGLDYLYSKKQRISEAEESVTRLIRKVARETEEVQKAMEGLELAKNQAKGDGGSGSIEDTALELKKGGVIKQAALVGSLLFGSRAITETILVLSSPYGEEHFLSAIAQALIALACAAYFLLVK